MATPRKHWWRVADSVGREPWSNDVAAAFLRLGCHLNTCWARDGLSAERAGRCVLSFGDLMGITGKNTIPACAEVLTRLSEAVSMEFELRGAVPLVYFARRSDALIKIGQTTNWPQRHRQLVREFGPIELLGAIGRTDCRVLEKRLHRELAPHRIAGEWFREEPAVSDWIARGQPLDSAWTDPGTYRGLPTAIVSWPNWPRFQALTRNESPSKSPVTAPVIPSPQDAPAPARRNPLSQAPLRSAAQGGLDLGTNPKPRRKAAKKPKPSSLAARAFCEEYKAVRGQNPTLSPRVLPDLGKIYEQQGEDLFRRSVRAFLGFDDEWLRVRSWRADAFVRDIERCSVRAQWDLEREQRPAPLEPPEGFEDLPEDLQQRGAALFGGADT